MLNQPMPAVSLLQTTSFDRLRNELEIGAAEAVFTHVPPAGETSEAMLR